MDDTPIDVKRRILAIGGLVCVLGLASFLFYYYGRLHKVIIDNRAVETADGQTLRPLASARVAVNKPALDSADVESPAIDAPVAAPVRPLFTSVLWPKPDKSIAETVEMMPRERILVKVLGPSFNLKYEAFDRSGNSLGLKETDVHLGFRDHAMVRLVKLQNGRSDYLDPYPNDSSKFQPAAEEAAKPATSTPE